MHVVLACWTTPLSIESFFLALFLTCWLGVADPIGVGDRRVGVTERVDVGDRRVGWCY